MALLPKDSLLAQTYFRRLRTLIDGRLDGSADLVSTILLLLQARYYPALIKGAPVSKHVFFDHPEVNSFVKWLGGLDALTAAFWLSSAYAYWVGKGVRDHKAMFFTPPSLSSRLIDDLISNGASISEHVWLDPACGGAAFLAPVAKRMAEDMHARGASSIDILMHIASHIVGNDIDPCLSFMSKEFIRMVLHDEIKEAGIEPEFRVTSVDALSELRSLCENVDVVICNPPYRKMGSSEVDIYREDYDEVISGQPNIYGLFFKLACSLLGASGIAGLLTPTSYLSGKYFASLRKYILENAVIRQIDIIPAMGAFFSVDQETAIAIAERKSAAKAQPCRTEVYRFERLSGFESVGMCSLPVEGEAWLVPRTASDVSLLLRCAQSPFRLSDYGYEARVGNFVWNRDKRETLREFSNRDSEAVFPLIWSRDILGNGGFEHGRGLKETAHGKFIDMGDVKAAGVIRRPSVALQRVTSSDQSKRLIGSVVPSLLMDKYGGVVGENHVVFLQQVDAYPKVSPKQLADILRTEVVDRLFRCISGAVNVSIYELSHLPMPDPNLICEMLLKYSSIDEAVEAAYRSDKGFC